MRVLTSKEIYDAEQKTIGSGLHTLVLMENAAAALEKAVLEKHKKGGIMILCGIGNNGGDGFALSRRLFLKGYKVFVVCPFSEEKLKKEALTEYRIFLNAGGQVRFNEGYLQCPPCDVYVDALFGTGLSGNLEGEAKKIIEWLNSQEGTVIAADLPSGVSCDTGKIWGVAVKAHITVTFGFGKPGLYLYPGRDYCGHVTVADIGLLPFTQSRAEVLDLSDIHALWPKRRANSYKGAYGHGLIFAGSKGFAGAGELCGKGALRTGIGLLTLCVPEVLWTIYQEKIPEAMTFAMMDKDGAFEGSDAEKILPLMDKANVLAIGPGITTKEGSLRILTYILENRRIPIVIDADALNLLALQRSTKLMAGGDAVLTPHPGEMARLTGKSTADILEHFLETARDYAAQTGAVVVLKGATSIIARPDGHVTFNINGNAGMGTGGSGDVLTGIISALLGQGLSAYNAARVGCYIHGMAGDLAAKKMGLAAMTAGELVEMLPETLLKLNR